MTKLTTKRLTLRAAQDSDLAQLFRIFSNDQAMRYWSNLPHKTPEDTKPSLEKLKAPGPRTYFVFDYQGQVIGLGGIHSGTEIGFILHPDHWRQGFATEALQVIMNHVWETTDWPHITADADPRNLASVGILNSLGFRVSGFAKDTFCVGREWSDSVFLSCPRPTTH